MEDIKTTCLDLLKANHNIILSGAPGTGKTYMAKQIADELTGGDKSRIGFVQFHPSYDYTDFVEGLRPTPPSGSTIGFERKDGIFKEFCEKALTKEITLKEAYDSLVDDIKKGKVTSITTYDGVVRSAGISTTGLITLPRPLNYKNIETLANTYKTKNDLDEVGPNRKEFDKVIGGSDSTAYWAVLNELYSRINSAPYIFIIDEINRGEMSKVFGELFFSIDPGYRGENGAVRTQYANMVSSPNAFDKVLGKTDPKDYGYFFVPENVYIIGTMNDIDRSVDSMDFAMRRRFLIKEIKAEYTQKDMLTDDAVIAKMDALNAVIECKSEKKIKAKLGTSYSLGASYFQKYYKYNDFKLLWEYHLEGILREYLRGTQDPEGDLKILKEVYDNA